MNQRETLCDYFDEDLVIRWSPSGRLLFGLVIESSENASDSDGEDSDDDSHKRSSVGDKWRHLRPGFAKIALYPNGNTAVVKESKVKLYDRSLLNGDVVQRLDPKTRKLVANSEHGFCSSTKIMATIKILGTNKVIENVDSNHLQMICNISEDTICLLDSWLGYVKEIEFKVTLKCRDGSLVLVSDLDISEFVDLLTQRENNDSEFNRDDYYIGQQLYGPKRYLKNGHWICQSRQMKRFMNCNSSHNSKINVVVEDVVVDSVSVNWLCCLSDENSPKNKSNNCDNSVNKNPPLQPRRLSRDGHSISGSHPIGDIVKGSAVQRIKCLNYFRKCSLQLGHLCYHTIKADDVLTTFSNWMVKESTRLYEECQSEEIDASDSDNLQSKESLHSGDTHKRLSNTKKFRVSQKKVKKKKLLASNRKSQFSLPINTEVGSRVPVEIIATNTRVTVVWQNGFVEENLPSISLYPVHHIDNHDFFPGDFVVENKDISDSYNYGVIQSCDGTSRTARVKWFSVSADSQSAHLVAEQDLSVYDIKDHPDFSFRSGVCVVRMPVRSDEEFAPPSRVGQVLELTTDGQLRCYWLDGHISLVWPQQLFIVGDYDSDDLWADSDSDYDYSDYTNDSEKSDGSWETDDEHNESSKKRISKSPKTNAKSEQNQSLMEFLQSYASQVEDWVKNGTGNCVTWHKLLTILRKVETYLDNNSSSDQLSTHLSNKIQQLSRRLKQLLPFSRTTETSDTNESKIDSDLQQTFRSISSSSSSAFNSNERSISELIDDLKVELIKNEPKSDFKIESNSETMSITNGDVIATNGDQVMECESGHSPDSSHSATMNGAVSESRGNVIFMESVPECHKYFNSSIEPKNPKEFLKRIRFEISLLKSSLPKDIVVVVFEDRIDLLSVLVVGPKETPYEDGLFLFDIQLASNYPNGPPIVHYVSFCSDRLNPNLYESGKVCISLLGTWTGKGSEVWAPDTSNLLQLIISIQGLILVSEPYYNEAGYSKQKGTAIASENSRLYNEMVVIKLIQSMTKMLITPPKTFEKQITEHIIAIADQFIARHESWAQISRLCISKSITSVEELPQTYESSALPAFPLLPASQGFCISLDKAIRAFKETIKAFV